MSPKPQGLSAVHPCPCQGRIVLHSTAGAATRRVYLSLLAVCHSLPDTLDGKRYLISSGHRTGQCVCHGCSRPQLRLAVLPDIYSLSFAPFSWSGVSWVLEISCSLPCRWVPHSAHALSTLLGARSHVRYQGDCLLSHSPVPVLFLLSDRSLQPSH